MTKDKKQFRKRRFDVVKWRKGCIVAKKKKKEKKQQRQRATDVCVYAERLKNSHEAFSPNSKSIFAPLPNFIFVFAKQHFSRPSEVERRSE